VADDLLIFSDADRMPRPFLPKKFGAHPCWIGLAQYVDSNRLYSRVPDLGYLKPFIATDLLRRTAIQYDERLRIGEDYEIMARLLSTGTRIRLEPTANYLYRKHPQSVSHRIDSAHIAALLEADERLVDSMGELRPNVARAFARRKHSLNAMLTYDRVVVSIKAGRYAKAASLIAQAPQIWPLLGRPVRARLERVFWQNGQSARVRGPRPQARIEAL
jgi:succinoglycan biosynthesis protein ExoO